MLTVCVPEILAFSVGFVRITFIYTSYELTVTVVVIKTFGPELD